MRVDVAELRRKYPRTRFDRDRHGNPRWYAIDPTGKKIRLREEPGTDAWIAEYKAATEGAHIPGRGHGPGTLGHLISAYLGDRPHGANPDFEALADITRDTRRNILRKIREESGDLLLTEITSANIKAGRDARRATPSQANNRIKILSALFSWGIENDRCLTNPTLGVKKLKPPRTGGYYSWTLEDCLQYEARHPLGTKARTAYALTLYLGLRRQDIPKLGPQHRSRDNYMRIQRRKKRGAESPPQEVWICAPLAEALDAFETRGLTYLLTEYGKPFSTAGLGNKFREWCDQAGLPQCSAHGLRKAVAARLREAGCSIGDIQAVTDHDTSAEVDRYTRDAARKAASKRALENTFGEQNVPPVSTGGRKVGGSPENSV